MKKSYFVFFASLLLMFSVNGFSQTKIASFYQATTVLLAGQDNPISANFKTADINAVTLSRGPGIIYASNSTYSYVANFTNGETKAQAYTAGSYYQLAVTAEAGKYMSFTTINARLRTATAQSVTNYRWKYSIDDLAESAFKEIGSTDNSIGLTDTQGEDRSEDVSNILALQSIAPGKTVYFRIYAWGASVSGGNSGFGFGKSNTSEREVLSLMANVTNKPLLLEWSLYSAPSSTASFGVTALSPALNASTLTRGPGLELSSLSRGFVATSKNLSASYIDASNNNEYYSFNLQPKIDVKINVSALNFKYRRKATGANNYQLAYVKDGGAVTLVPGANGVISATDDGTVLADMDVSTIVDLQNLTDVNNVEFRIYLWGATDITSVFGLGRNLVAGESSLSTYGTVEDMGTLPVTLTSFTAKKELNGIKLSWKTVSEKNNSHFEVYRSSNVKPNILVGTVSGAGNATTVNNYSLFDYEPLAGVNYYQLRQVDRDGKYEDSKIISINNSINANAEMRAYQNDNSIELSVQGEVSGKGLLQISDVNGRIVYKQHVDLNGSANNSFKISFLGNSKGIYVAKLTNNKKALITKFIW
ncbi:T9SS type A sorting domain-containing protein [Pedobacter arcticus]|uniref:T9SS type A sorting domain-containing protein n=1 Tax=Pedobacter arcticus TaxID=752140 RepID=UPI0002ED680E|nr:T9SS type A sorting domain-containing protein [Pedobacter arcticus]